MIDMKNRTVIHNRSGYVNGCRCETCCQANSDYQRAYRGHERRGNLPVGPMLALFGDLDNDDIASLLSVEKTTISEWQRGGIPLDIADKIVVSVGAHPYVVWGDAYWTAEL